MKSSIKTSLGKLLANVLRYYYFDRYLYMLYILKIRISFFALDVSAEPVICVLL